MNENIDHDVVAGFGDEWSRFDQSTVSEQDMLDMFAAYFAIFPWQELPAGAIGFDLGCGSGRWARLVAPRVGHLHCVEPSAKALAVAKRNLTGIANCTFHQADANSIPLPEGAADFGYSLGVLHHVPNTESALKACVTKLKPGAPFLLYLYFAFDNKPWWYRALWRASDLARRAISHAPHPLRYVVSQILATVLYWPAARLALLVEYTGFDVDSMPLAFYRRRSFYVMRTDALDRFGTRLEKRFTRAQVATMMADAGLGRVVFSAARPYWCALGNKL
jgi:SAM-dependent methyltransferase